MREGVYEGEEGSAADRGEGVSENFNAKQAHEYVDRLLKEVETWQKKFEELQATFAGKKVQELKPYLLTTKRYADDIERDPSSARSAINADYEKDKIIHEENRAIAESNAATVQAVITLIAGLGLPTRVSSWERGRIKWKEADWKQFFNAVPTMLKVNINDVYKDLIRRCDESEKKKAEADRQKKAAEEREQKKQETLKYIGTLEAKYGQSFSSPYEAKQFLLSKDKYLRLAYYLQKNRGDWSDGADYAREGLRDFTIETDVDRKIHAEISDIIMDFEDGRSFRDCEWNYTVLFGMSDETVKAEFDRLQELDPERDW